MRLAYIISLLLFSVSGFAQDVDIDASSSLFPQHMLTQFYINRTAGELTEEELNEGGVSIYRFGFRSFPEKIIEIALKDFGEEARQSVGYSLNEIETIWKNATTEEEKKKARRRIGKTPTEVANLLASKSTISNDDKDEILKAQQRLVVYDAQTEEFELFLTLPYPMESVEKAYRSYKKWPQLSDGFYRESRLLSVDELKDFLGDKFDDSLITDNSWFHFFGCKILTFEWSGFARYIRTESSVQVKDIYNNKFAKSDKEIKRVVLRWNLSPLFDPEDEYYSDPDSENYEINVSEGYLLLEEYVNKKGEVDPNKTVVLLKSQFRILDEILSTVFESVRELTMVEFISSFIENLKEETGK